MSASSIRLHIEDRHPQIKPVPRSNADCARKHARAHHRYHLDHHHAEDGLGALIGPGSNRRRPSGWSTGLNVLETALVQQAAMLRRDSGSIHQIRYATRAELAERPVTRYVCQTCGEPMADATQASRHLKEASSDDPR